VEDGGIGAGTRIRCGIRVLGRTRFFTPDIPELVPGRVLVETIRDVGTVATFTVEPFDGGSGPAGGSEGLDRGCDPRVPPVTLRRRLTRNASRPMALRRSVRAALALAALSLAAPAISAGAVSRTDRGAGASLSAAAERAGLRPAVLRLALQAHARAVAEGRSTRTVLTVIDYSLPSRQRRLWVLDLARGVVLEHELVAHGSGSGGDLARVFSNRQGSNQSSLGTFVTGATYLGKHGMSLRLYGLDGDLNDRAAARAIVVHGADYVSEGAITRLGRLGRSQGCPALSAAAAPRIIRLIRGGTVIFAYHPSARLEAHPPASS
jgi:hypothetical protein